jgi:hypothetical protein
VIILVLNLQLPNVEFPAHPVKTGQARRGFPARYYHPYCAPLPRFGGAGHGPAKTQMPNERSLRMEYWNIGILGLEKSIFSLKHYSIVPVFQDYPCWF